MLSLKDINLCFDFYEILTYLTWKYRVCFFLAAVVHFMCKRL